MVLTKRNKILAVLIGAAVAAFVVDRFVLGYASAGPEQACAAAIPSAETAGGAPDEAGLRAPPQSPITLADRLAGVAGARGLDGMKVPDAFCPPRSWFGPDPVRPSAAAKGDSGRDFLGSHRLTATIVGAGGGGMAIIDGQCVVVGKTVDGFRLVSVTRRQAVLEADGAQVTLRLPQDTGGD